MSAAANTLSVTIGDAVFEVIFAGFGVDLLVLSPGAEPLAWRPWTLGEHLRALGLCLRPGADGPGVDGDRYAALVLDAMGAPTERWAELAPLALWWAATPDARVLGEGLPTRPWTFAERSQALTAASEAQPDGGLDLKLDVYLHAMLRASTEHEGWEALPAAAGHRLLTEVILLNHPDLEEERAAEPPALTRALLSVCRALGLTPSQVRALPAAEVDRVLDLLALDAAATPSAAPRRARRPKLADYPDAVVILAED
ncbi:hypothetical protein L6R49_14960 [Myxococcota bacterium]|nr:hypothetical protein [Myxococcota bacterium]